MGTASSEAERAMQALHAACSQALAATFARSGDSVAPLYGFTTEMDAWIEALSAKPERLLIESANQEFLVAMLNAAQAQYRNAFKGLRLVLELCLQGVFLSSDLISLREWLASDRDTNWSQLTGEDGVFCRRFVRAMFPDLVDRAPAFRGLATKLYRELSECIHGNVPSAIPLPNMIEFDQAALDLWVSKATTVRLVVHFALTMRYLLELAPTSSPRLEPVVLDHLGNIPAVRAVFGGRTE